MGRGTSDWHGWKLSWVLVMACVAQPVRAQAPVPAFTEWAKAHAIPVEELALEGDFDDLSPLRDVIGSARMVAYGEPTHGAREPLEFRNRLFRYLVEELGFTAFALESSLPRSRRLHDFVLEADSEYDEAISDAFSYGFGSYQANQDLLEWIRAYNADPAHERKVHVYGVDIEQLALDTLALSNALAYLQRVDTTTARETGDRLRPYLEPVAGRTVPLDLTATEQAELVLAVDDLISVLVSGRPDFTAATSVVDFEWALQSVLVAQQGLRFFREFPPAWKSMMQGGQAFELPPLPFPAEWSTRREVRDASMAENVKWALAREGPEGRIFVFAHNGHVMNADLKGGWWQNLEPPPVPMGRHLRTMFSEDLVIIGTSSVQIGTDLGGAPAADAGRWTLDSAMASVGMPAFLLDLRAARSTPAVERFLSQEHTLRHNYITEVEISPSHAFDVFFFVNTLTEAPVVKQ